MPLTLTDIYSVKEKRYRVYTDTITVNAGGTFTDTYDLGDVTGDMIVMVGATYTTAPSSAPSFALWEQRGNTFYPLVSATLTANSTNAGGANGYHFSTPNRLFYGGQPVRIGIQNGNQQGNFRVTIVVIR